MLSGPYIALLTESEPVYATLRRVVKVVIAPMFLEGRRLNSRDRADEELRIKLLCKAWSEPFLFDTEDDEDDDWVWNPGPHNLRCYRGHATSLGDAGVIISRHSKRNFGTRVVGTDLPDFVETELRLVNTTVIFGKCSSLSPLTEKLVDKLLGDYGGKFVTLVDLVGDPDVQKKAASLASLYKGAKLRHVRTTRRGAADAVRRACAMCLEATGPFAPGLMLFCGDDVDAAMGAAVRHVLAKHKVKDAWHDHIKPDDYFNALVQAERADARSLLLGTRLPRGAKPATSLVYPMERVTIFAWKVVVLACAIFAVLPEGASFAANLACTIGITAQALVSVFACQFFDGSLREYLATARRFG